MKKVYIDTNVFYNAFCPVENDKLADWLLNQLNPNLQGVSSEWTILEMFRALKKQVNLKKIEVKDAKVTLDFFLSEIGEMTQTRSLQLVPVSRITIILSRNQIFENNLYAADALHATVAIQEGVNNFITFDRDFPGKLDLIPIINPLEEGFQKKILKLKETM